MGQIFTGTFQRNLDSKNRLLVPSEIRDALSPDDRQGLYLIPSRKCILVWPRSYLDSYLEAQASDPIGNTKFNRDFYSQMIFRAFDGTGRIVLPGDLPERFPSRSVLIAGAGRYLELWEPDAFASSITPLDFE